MVLVADRVIDCTGPETDARRFPIPLLRQLVADGLTRHDPLFLGVDAVKDGNVIGKDGAEQDRLYAIGPLLKGVLLGERCDPGNPPASRGARAESAANRRGGHIRIDRSPRGWRGKLRWPGCEGPNPSAPTKEVTECLFMFFK